MTLRKWLTKLDVPIGEIAQQLGISTTTLRRWSEATVPMTRRADVISVSDGQVTFEEHIPKTVAMLFLIHDAIMQLEEMQLWQEQVEERRILEWTLRGLRELEALLQG